MKLYNTLSRQVEDFKPQNDSKVAFYSCGPTVYDYPHIGNWYTFIRYDELFRVLKASGYKVDWVMNITDVGHLVSDADEGEDKLEKGAKREGLSAWDIAKKYTDYFITGLERLNINQPTYLPKATDHIQEQIDLIKTLEQKGHTYVIDDGVYFDTNTFKDYGQMAQLDLKHLKEGARVEANPQKKNPTDFALWKFSPKDQKRDMEWDSPWGKGFPGWHLECSAMSMKFLGETLDIHGGGIDHIPVHHTNEIAQSEAATGKTFANYWFHCNFNLVDNQKMAKSLGNFFTLEDIEKKSFDLMAFRLLVLQSHYRTEAHFSWDNLEAASNALKHFQAWADLRFQGFNNKGLADKYKKIQEQILAVLQDDLNTPEALALLHQVISEADELGSNKQAIGELVSWLDNILGLELGTSKDITDSQKDLIQKRQQARDNKDWKLSDELRDNLAKQGLAIRDTSSGQTWSRL